MSESWEAALKAASTDVVRAEQDRARVFRAANEAGVSMRTIAKVVGSSAATVHRIIGLKARPDQDALLKSKASA